MGQWNFNDPAVVDACLLGVDADQISIVLGHWLHVSLLGTRLLSLGGKFWCGREDAICKRDPIQGTEGHCFWGSVIHVQTWTREMLVS